MLQALIDLAPGALRPDWYGVPGIRNVPDFVDQDSYMMLEYEKVLIDCSLGGIRGK